MIRWHLSPGLWRRTGAGVVGPTGVVTVRADGEVALALTDGWESPCYGRRRRLPVFEIRCGAATRSVVSAIRFGGDPA
ncbi:MAG: hypothetical protein RML45_03915 [Acetobacteraceae bacterium]|nr:hypothetical protein [Acetobacteraceae bacterium]